MKRTIHAGARVTTAALALVLGAAGWSWSAAVAAEAADGAAAPLELTLERCIEIGIEHSVQFLNEEESFILQQLSTSLQRHNYGLLWTSTLAAETDSDEVTSEGASVAIARRLLTGGELQLDVGTSGSQTSGLQGGEDDDAYASSVSLSIEQPLLRGAGRLVAREELTQAERDLVYAGRDLILFKQQFLLDIVQQYYQLTEQRERIRNQEEKLGGAKWLRDRTTALKGRELASEIDELRARNNVLRAENDLNDARESYELALDRLKLDLGLPVDRAVVVVEKALAVTPTEPALGPSLEAALVNRLDLKTALGAAEDARRALAIARNALRGDLDLTARVGYTSESGTSFGDQRFGDPEWSVGLSYAIPLDRAAEKASYRERLIAYARAQRRADRVHDEVVLEVRRTLRELRRAEATIAFQEKNVELAEQRHERAKADLERGEATTRDVEEAEDEKLAAKNAHVRAQVDYIIATFQLRKDTGQLDFDKEWRELIR